jgi:hypothetical protein
MSLTSTSLLLMAVLTLSTCLLNPGRSLDETYPGNDSVVWVTKYISGGAQCDLRNRFTPPDTAALLRRRGVPVFESAVEHQPVCSACSICPAYAALHFELIRKTDIHLARKAGFEPDPERPIPPR